MKKLYYRLRYKFILWLIYRYFQPGIRYHMSTKRYTLSWSEEFEDTIFNRKPK